MNKAEEAYEERLDYLREITNIASGNTATAIAQILSCAVETRQPEIFFVEAAKTSLLFNRPDEPVLCARLNLLGDVTGSLYLVLPDGEWKNLLQILKKVTKNTMSNQVLVNTSAIAEIANILAGVYLTAIHDVSRLNIFHTVPMLAIDMIQSLIDESVTLASRELAEILIIKNEFIIMESNLTATLIIIPNGGSIQTLFASLRAARMQFGMEG